MAVNLRVDFAEDRFSDDAVVRARLAAEARGYSLVHMAGSDDRLAAWIDWQFAPSWWSSEVRAGDAWYALDADGEIAGFAAFDARGLRFPWLGAYRDASDVGIFGPFGVAPAHRGSGIGAALLDAALASLRSRGYAAALIPAVGGERLIAMYADRTGARVVDEFSYDAPQRYRTTILASGAGTNAQAVIEGVENGHLPLVLTGLIANSHDAFALQRARRVGIFDRAVVWNRVAETRAQYDVRLIDDVAATEPDLVLLLGWMHLLPPAFLARFPHVLNVHPAFLPFDPAADEVTMPDGTTIPAFRGAHGVRDALAANVTWSGASVHRVTSEMDRGAIVVRTPFLVNGARDTESFVRLLRPIEHGAVLASIRRWVFEQSHSVARTENSDLR